MKQKLIMYSLFLVLTLQSALATENGASIPLLKSELAALPWYQSTILGDLAKPAVDRSKPMQLPSIHAGKSLAVRFWKSAATQVESRGLFLLLPGTGGNSTSPMSNSIAEALSDLGYDSLILVNPYSTEFQGTFSSDGLIGIPQKDLRDVNRMLEAAIGLYVRQYRAPRSLNILGSSLGGLYAAMEGGNRNGLKFEKIIAVNPPIHLDYAMDRVDDAIRAAILSGLSWASMYENLLPAFLKAHGGVNLANLSSIQSSLPGTVKLGSEDIGKSFQETIIEITRGLYSTASIYSQKQKQSEIESGISQITFQKYMGLVETAVLSAGFFRTTSFALLMDEVSLAKILAEDGDPSRVYVITNADDFIIRPSFLREISPVLGSRLQVFSAGGHCGNFWTPSFRNSLLNILGR